MVEQAALSGTPQNGVYSQTLFLGNFFLVLSLVDGAEVDKELGRNTLAKIEEIITQSPQTSPKELVEIILAELTNGITVEMLVAKAGGDKLAIAGTSGMLAKIVRKSTVVNLLSPTTTQQGVRVISGPVQDLDLLILGTADFSSLIERSDLAALPSQNIVEFRDNLLPKVESLENNAGIAALFARVEVEQNGEETLPPEDLAPQENVPKETSGGLSGLASKYLGRLPSPRGMYLKGRAGTLEPSRLRRPLYLAIVVLICLVSIIAFQLRSKALEQRTAQVLAMEKQVTDGIDSASKLSGVNDNVAREILVQTKKDFLSKAEAEFGPDWQSKQKPENKNLKTILAALDEKIATVAHIYTLGNLDLFYDFGLLKSGVKVVSVGLAKGEIFALDQVNGAAYSVGTKNKTAAILTGSEDLKAGKFIDGLENDVFVLTNAGINKIDRSTNPATSKQIIKASESWGNISGLKTFAGNLYLLDTTNNQVWKYQNTDFGFASASAYLRSGGLDFSKVVGMAIDGQIYVLSSSGNVVRFASGYADEFKMTSLPDQLSNPSGIFVSDETENIYILDNNNSRVVITDKKGGYLAEYIIAASSEGLGASKLLIDESVKKVFLVSSDKIYSFNLR